MDVIVKITKTFVLNYLEELITSGNFNGISFLYGVLPHGKFSNFFLLKSVGIKRHAIAIAISVQNAFLTDKALRTDNMKIYIGV